MIDRKRDLPVTKQAEVLHTSRGSVYYLPRPVPEADLAIMRRLDRLHLEFPFAGSWMLRGLLVGDPPAAMFFYSPDRCGGEHPEQYSAGYAALMHDDAYAGFTKLYEANLRQARTSKPRAGHMHGASSLTWRGAARRRSPPRRSSASMPCAPSGARSTASSQRSACACARTVADR